MVDAKMLDKISSAPGFVRRWTRAAVRPPAHCVSMAFRKATIRVTRKCSA